MIYDDLTVIWIDVASAFLMLCFLVFIVFLIWQHLKNKKAQKEIIANYNHNLNILEELKNRF